MEEGNLKMEAGKLYFVQEMLDKEKNIKIFLSDELRQKVFDIIRDESVDAVDFIMSEICDVISDKKYKLLNEDKTQILLLI